MVQLLKLLKPNADRSPRPTFLDGLQVVVIIVWQRGVLRLLHFVLQFGLPLWIHQNLRRSDSRHGDELQVRIADQFASQPEERLLEVVVGFSADVVVLAAKERRAISRCVIKAAC